MQLLGVVPGGDELARQVHAAGGFCGQPELLVMVRGRGPNLMSKLRTGAVRGGELKVLSARAEHLKCFRQILNLPVLSGYLKFASQTAWPRVRLPRP